MTNNLVKKPSFIQSLTPILALISMLSASVYFFGEDSSYGPNQIALIIAAGFGLIIGMRNGQSWKELEAGITRGVSHAIQPIIILLAIGSLIGAWVMAGIVPTLIYYGLEIINPTYFYFSTCLICAIVSVVIGSSWTTAGTIGIAMIGVAGALDLSLAITAGAIISGSYFGDKLSPLSDTTNLAPAVAGTELFTHIRHMLWTTLPSIVIALIAFLVIGLNHEGSTNVEDVKKFMAALDANYDIGWHMLIPPAIVFYMIMKKVPAFPAIFIGALVGGIFGLIFQPDLIVAFVGDESLSRIAALSKGLWMALFQGYTSTTGVEAIDSLLSRGGMSSMLNTVWLIITAMVFGGVMEVTRLLQRMTQGILQMAGSSRSLLISTLATSIGTNVVTSDQYISIVLPGRMYKLEFDRRGLHRKNLSRALEDGGTVTSVLVPWNTCGAYMSQTLGVATFVYLPFCFFNLITPIISGIYAITGFTIDKVDEAELAEMQAEEAAAEAALSR